MCCVGAPRAALGGRTHRLCLDAARIRGGEGSATGQANEASDGAGDVVVIPRSWMVAVGARVDVIAPSTDGGTAALGRVSSSSSAST